MKRVLILGATGMLGNAVAKVFLEKKEEYLVSITAKPETVFLHGHGKGSPGNPVVISSNFQNMFEKLSDFRDVIAYNALELDLGKVWKVDDHPDYIINCVGVIEPFTLLHHNQNIIRPIRVKTKIYLCPSEIEDVV